MVGGGSGGHITPVLSVAHELKRLSPEARIIYVGQKGDSLSGVVEKNKDISDIKLIRAGKFRRYHGESWLSQLFDVKTVALNIRDFFRVIVGIFQSFVLLGRLKPDAIFIKGGFVGVPIGVAARIKRIPYLTHDSDSVAGLANRIIGRWAAIHATGMSPDYYAYPPEKTIQTGVPVDSNYMNISKDDMSDYRSQLGVTAGEPAVLIVGGGLGSMVVNDLAVHASKILFNEYPNLHIFHITGLQHQKSVRAAYDSELHATQIARVNVLGYTKELFKHAAIADVVIGRGGATHLAEMAILRKACVIIPHPNLTGGHQLKNAQHLADSHSVILFNQQQHASELASIVSDLLKHPDERKRLGNALHNFARTDASAHIAHLIMQLAEGKEHVVTGRKAGHST